jgi:ribosome-binding protein aMBF1 (putative translation factor)
MRRRRWRFYETASGAKPVQSFLDNLVAIEAAEVVAAMKEIAREGLHCNITDNILNTTNSMARRTQAGDDLDRYISERDAREPRFAALVTDAETRLAFGRQMAERRRASGQTQTQVAARMQTSPAIVSRLESGHDVRVSTLEKYAAALGLRLELNAVSARKPASKASRTPRAKK